MAEDQAVSEEGEDHLEDSNLVQVDSEVVEEEDTNAISMDHQVGVEEEVDLVVEMIAIISECDIELSRALVMGKYRSKYVIDESSCFVLVGMRYRYEYIHCVKQATWMLYIARWVW